MTVSAQYLAEHVDEVLAAAESGEPIIIERSGSFTYSLMSQPSPQGPQGRKPIVLGAGEGLLRLPTEDEWEQMDREWEQSFASKFGMGGDEQVSAR